MTVFFSQKLPDGHRERFAALAELGYTPLFTLHQRHSDTVIRLRKPYRFPGLDALIANQPEGDAVVTDQPGLFIGVKTADCVPILLWDETAGVIAAVHAGWRGTAVNIAGKTAHVMRDEFRAHSIRAAIGPCICQNCFTTRDDVPEAMPLLAREYILQTAPGRYQVDLPGINTALLRDAGVMDIQAPHGCTACDPERYWSHRKHGLARGLQVSLIGMGAELP
ncbi:MAG: polyphenol oxidase family protein [Oscillospiraceae bacterium]|jgi:YfiH family protein|nr:polyphenol oxidase family protein [Oscillospiraceae bacterium]